MKHAHFLQMGGFRLVCSEKDEYGLHGTIEPLYKCYRFRSQLGDNLWEGVLDFDKMRELLEENVVDLPATTEEEINDRSKGDAFSKGIALLQILWFIMQMIARHMRGLSITELELTTVALAGMNSVMFLFWWNKPLNVQCPIVIRTKYVEKILADKPYQPEFELLKYRSRSEEGWNTGTDDGSSMTRVSARGVKNSCSDMFENEVRGRHTSVTIIVFIYCTLLVIY